MLQRLLLQGIQRLLCPAAAAPEAAAPAEAAPAAAAPAAAAPATSTPAAAASMSAASVTAPLVVVATVAAIHWLLPLCCWGLVASLAAAPADGHFACAAITTAP